MKQEKRSYITPTGCRWCFRIPLSSLSINNRFQVADQDLKSIFVARLRKKNTLDSLIAFNVKFVVPVLLLLYRVSIYWK